MKRIFKGSKSVIRKGIVGLSAFLATFFYKGLALAQGPGGGGDGAQFLNKSLQDLSSSLSGSLTYVQSICYVAIVVCGFVGGVKVYQKLVENEQGSNKSVVAWIVGLVFFAGMVMIIGKIKGQINTSGGGGF